MGRSSWQINARDIHVGELADADDAAPSVLSGEAGGSLSGPAKAAICGHNAEGTPHSEPPERRTHGRADRVCLDAAARSSILQRHAQAETLEPFVEAKAAAEFLHYSARSIKQMAREGRIPAHPFGTGSRKRWYFLISELAEHLRSQVNSGHGEAGRDKAQRRVI